MRFSVIQHRCECGKCEVMPTVRESICCREISVIDNKLQETSSGNPCCITEHEGFQPVCLDVWVLQTAGFQTQQEFGRHATSGPVHKLVHTIYIYIYIYIYIHMCGTSSPHIQGPSLHSLSATGKVVLGISWSESTCCVTFVCSL